MSPFVTFEEAEMNHLLDGMKMTAGEVLQWLEDAGDFARWTRSMIFEEGAPVTDHDGMYWSEDEYLGIPEWARRDG